MRDALLLRKPADWDIATLALPQEIKACFSELRTIDTGIAHGTVALITPHGPVEATTYRVDGEYAGHRRPLGVSFTRDILEDLARRDFTVNAMAFHPGRGLLDPFGGQGDLEAGLLRCVGEPARRFDEDALRMLRGVRFAAALGFEIEGGSLKAALSCLGLIGGLSGERVRSELTKLLLAPGAQGALIRYAPVVLSALPELAALPQLEDAPPLPVPRWAALLRDCPPEEAKAVLTRLRFPRRELSEIARIIRQLPLVGGGGSLSARLELAGLTLSGLRVSGGDLVELGYAPGPGIGRALELLLRLVLRGELPNSRAALLSHAREIM